MDARIITGGIDDGAVVALDGGVEVGGLAAQIRAQPPGVEDRQADRRPDGVLLARRLGKKRDGVSGQKSRRRGRLRTC